MSLAVDGVWKAGVWDPTVWADGVWREGSAPAPVQPIQPSGGYDLPTGRRRSKEEVRADRERFGILIDSVPKSAAKVVAQVAQAPEPDVSALREALQAKRIAYRARYAELMQLEIEFRRQRQDEELALLLLLH